MGALFMDAVKAAALSKVYPDVRVVLGDLDCASLHRYQRHLCELVKAVQSDGENLWNEDGLYFARNAMLASWIFVWHM